MFGGLLEGKNHQDLATLKESVLFLCMGKQVNSCFFVCFFVFPPFTKENNYPVTQLVCLGIYCLTGRRALSSFQEANKTLRNDT